MGGWNNDHRRGTLARGSPRHLARLRVKHLGYVSISVASLLVSDFNAK
jgi:hypothetical protein